MFRADPVARTGWRWGGALAAMLVFQSLVLTAIFWGFANDNHRRAIEHGLADDCTFFALTPSEERPEELRERLSRDIHREQFLALFDPRGRLIAGNVARLPAASGVGRSIVAAVAPTELPGRTSDVARLTVCAMPDGTRLLTGVDLDDAEEALRLVWRSLLLALVPGLLLALGVGLMLGRRAARQVDAVRRLTARIVAGDLRERLPVGRRPDSVGLLWAQVNAMLDRLQLLVADVRGIGDDIAHQLRTPLTRLRAGLERGLREAGDPRAFAAVIERALAEIDSLLGVVAALLRLRELEDHERRSRFAAVDLARLIEDACDLHRPLAEDRGIALLCQVRAAATVRGDASLLMEAVANLIDNAIKFGPAPGKVTVALDRDDAGVTVTVGDEGTGVAAAERALVTQRFYRGRGAIRGTGLGLALVKAIADLHGFTLRFAERGSAAQLVCTEKAEPLIPLV
ncbi:HAMP domain-containing histidine kinase [Sphingomonas yunnanensis]|uniref:sensor histidine kinase n=1 Tax=Sphingomonas yunnanensis TaxID=310400 RepID=UPI001CA617E9|nr:HAMP domain-containing sensor histidine kinase [Sphingomonas yunnanensis]MBY9064712.1 HAMP domain-containing histidine kinase [Sphingomonas yunnanensis]